MSAIHIIEYLGGLGIFGLIYWILNGIQEEMNQISVQGDVYTFLMYIWSGVLLMYLIFGGIWVARMYNEDKYRRFY